MEIYIVPISYLNNDLVERFFLSAGAYFFIVVLYYSVSSCLLFVIAFECFVDQFVLYFLYRRVTIFNIIYCSAGVYIFSGKGTPMVKRFNDKLKNV